MITKNQLLAAPEAELPELLGEVFELEWGTCKWNKLIGRRDEIPQYRCSECGRECIGAAGPQACKKQPPKIDTHDWNVAMKYRDRAVEKHGDENWSIAKAEASGIKRLDLKYSFDQLQIACRLADQFYSTKAQPRHYQVAAAVCEIRDDPSA